MIEQESVKTQTEQRFLNGRNDLTVALNYYQECINRNLHICFPACVYSYDRSTHRATVMPLVKQAFYDEKWFYLRRQPFEVSVRTIQAGGFSIDFPLFVGDTGWVFSSDRNTLFLKQNGSLTNSVLAKDRPIQIVEDEYQTQPADFQIHSLVNGFFIPDNWGPWEPHRFKDNPKLAVGEAFYIGASMDTPDPNPIDPYQDGLRYEGKTTSSLVLVPDGGGHLSSSGEGGNKNSHVSAEKDTARLYAEKPILDDDGERIGTLESSITVNSGEGITIRQDNPEQKKHVIVSANTEGFSVKVFQGTKVVTLDLRNGELSISSTGDVNVNSQGTLNVKAAKEAYVQAQNARVVAEREASVSANRIYATAKDTANINAGTVVNIGAVGTTNINGGSAVNIASGESINMTALEEVNMVTGSDVTIMSKKKGAKISVSTLSKESQIEIRSQGSNSPINIESSGEYSDIKLSAEMASVNLQGKGVYIGAESIDLNGAVTIGGSLELNGNQFTPGTIMENPAWQY